MADGEAAARSCAEAPAFNTAAHAVPSGYFKIPCSLTIKARRSGIIIKIPNNPPRIATIATRVSSKSNPRIRIAGIVTPTPNAMDSPALPAVCVMLCSKIVASRHPNTRDIARKMVSEITATGIDALTVSPTFKVRNSDDAPKIIPRNVPMITARHVNSCMTVCGAMKASCSASGETGGGVVSVVAMARDVGKLSASRLGKFVGISRCHHRSW